MSCLFCQIVAGDIPSGKVYEDDMALAFHDITPQAPTHVLVVPKVHISNLTEISPANSQLIAHLFEVIAKLSRELELSDGFRVVANQGEFGGQTVDHLHFHLLGGRQLSWPPG